jgi:hypothetical protein
VTFRNRQAKALAYLCAATALAACSPNPEAGRPNTTPTAPTSISPSGQESAPPTSPPVAPPKRPASAEGSTLAAGEAFIGYYVDLINYSYETGDSEPLLSESDKGCVGCNALAEYLRRINGRNGGMQGDYKNTLLDVAEISRADGGRLAGAATIKSGDYVERLTPGASPVPQEGRTGSMEFALASSSGGWVMFEMQLKE